MRTELRRAVTALSSSPRLSSRQRLSPSSARCFHCASRTWAVAHPITAHGPPPKAPTPAPEFNHDPRRGDAAKNQNLTGQQEQQQQQQQSQTGAGAGAGAGAADSGTRVSQAKSSLLKRRFWKDVHVQESSDGYQVLLDTRPVRNPAKDVLTVPGSKRHLAEAIALEWDLLASAQQALKQHLIPLTSLTTRAIDIVREDESGQQRIRQEIVRTAMRYLDTDTLLCWVPEKDIHNKHIITSGPGEANAPKETLRAMQMRTAHEIIDFLSRTVWPGIEIKPVLDENSIMPTPQSQTTLDTIRSWISSLPAYELAGLERAILASKSLLVAVRLVVEWGEAFTDLQERVIHGEQQQQTEGGSRFGVEEAARASSLEVSYQTGMWGEVEDTHDVEREDLRRQLGSVILLVSGDRS